MLLGDHEFCTTPYRYYLQHTITFSRRYNIRKILSDVQLSTSAATIPIIITLQCSKNYKHLHNMYDTFVQ